MTTALSHPLNDQETHFAWGADVYRGLGFYLPIHGAVPLPVPRSRCYEGVSSRTRWHRFTLESDHPFAGLAYMALTSPRAVADRAQLCSPS